MSEEEQINQRYAQRKLSEASYAAANKVFAQFAQTERELLYAQVIKNYFGNNLNALSLLEIGAGEGVNLPFFNQLGFEWEQLYANELLHDRVKQLKRSYPKINIIEGNALDLAFEQKFDIIFQSTVFTSILDLDFRKQLAHKMWSMLKPGGIILWYDFTYNNPNNKDVLKVSKNELLDLFPAKQLLFSKKLTLAPPIGRKVGKAYNLVNTIFPMLRTHLMAVFKKESSYGH